VEQEIKEEICRELLSKQPQSQLKLLSLNKLNSPRTPLLMILTCLLLDLITSSQIRLTYWRATVSC